MIFFFLIFILWIIRIIIRILQFCWIKESYNEFIIFIFFSWIKFFIIIFTLEKTSCIWIIVRPLKFWNLSLRLLSDFIIIMCFRCLCLLLIMIPAIKVRLESLENLCKTSSLLLFFNFLLRFDSGLTKIVQKNNQK